MRNSRRGGHPFFQAEQHSCAVRLSKAAFLSAREHLVDRGRIKPMLAGEIGDALALAIQRGAGLLGCTDTGHSSDAFK